jgi:hypothetical protein
VQLLLTNPCQFPILFTWSTRLATLHIEHPITDFATWKAAFERFSEKRTEGGVTAHTIYQPVDDPAYVIVQLDFATTEQAQNFQMFLESRGWSTPTNSPGLASNPHARVLVTVA